MGRGSRDSHCSAHPLSRRADGGPLTGAIAQAWSIRLSTGRMRGRTPLASLTKSFVSLRRARGVGSPRAGGAAKVVEESAASPGLLSRPRRADPALSSNRPSRSAFQFSALRRAQSFRASEASRGICTSGSTNSYRSKEQGRVVAQLVERVKSLTVHSSVTGPKDRGLSNHEAASSNLAGSSSQISARMGIGRALPGTVAQQRTTEHRVAAPRPIARRGPDGAEHRRRDAGATPAGPGTIFYTV
jgi:hypothetical protein